MYELKVKGMTCGSCAESLGDTLKELDPNGEVTVNLKQQIVSVRTKIEQSAIVSLVEGSGYPVLEVKRT